MKRRWPRLVPILLCFSAGLGWPLPSVADELMDNWGPHSVGAMHSFADSENCCSFDQAEIFLFGNTPARWKWPLATLSTQYAVGVGNIRGRDDDTFFASAGINFDLVWKTPFSLQAGLRPTLMDESEFGDGDDEDDSDFDLGANFFFNINLGVYYYWKHLVAGLRYNHISNGDTHKENPGIDFYSIELRYLFNLPLQLP